MNYTFLASQIATLLVALLHIYFLVLEMFLWTKPYGRRVFSLTEEKAQLTKSLAANQGLYNGFLALGLLWGVAEGPPGIQLRLFFLGCVIVAGIFGSITASRKILYVQALPAAIAVVLIFLP